LSVSKTQLEQISMWRRQLVSAPNTCEKVGAGWYIDVAEFHPCPLFFTHQGGAEAKSDGLTDFPA
jgi:hypothetical protein